MKYNVNINHIILAGALVSMALPAFADSNTSAVNGSHNEVSQINGNGNNSPVVGSYNPSTTNIAQATPIVTTAVIATPTAEGGDAFAKGGNARAGATADNKGVEQTVNTPRQHRNPVNSAVAPSMYSVGDDNCQGSVSAGGTTQILGLSFGGTHTIEDCFRLKYARDVAADGEKDVAKAIRCQNESVAAAYAAMGKPCPRKAASMAPAAGPSTPARANTNPETGGVTYLYPTSARAIDRL